MDNDNYYAAVHVTTMMILKIFITQNLEGNAKAGAGVRAPEDGFLTEKRGIEQTFGLKNGLESKSEEEVQKAKINLERWRRVLGNDIEMIPIGLVAIWMAALVCP